MFTGFLFTFLSANIVIQAAYSAVLESLFTATLQASRGINNQKVQDSKGFSQNLPLQQRLNFTYQDIFLHGFHHIIVCPVLHSLYHIIPVLI